MADAASAFTEHEDSAAVAQAFIDAFGEVAPTLITFFCSYKHDGARISSLLRERFPAAAVIGCTSAGAFASGGQGRHGASALALGAGKVRRASAALARFDDGVDKGVRKATAQIAADLGIDLRTADPDAYVGVVLVEGIRMREEACNEALGHVAPLLSFVGGSAGDDAKFKETRLFCNGEESKDGAALVLMEASVPFVIVKTCNFEPSGTKFTITKADEPKRIIHELDGEPAAIVYARSLGLAKEQLDGRVFNAHPVGIMIDGVPWIRSPQRVVDGSSIKFYCSVVEGMEVDLMKRTDFLDGMNAALAAAATSLGGRVDAGVAFNCILRRLQMDTENLHAPFLATLSPFVVAGFHTYGESWLGHMNQTFTAILMR